MPKWWHPLSSGPIESACKFITWSQKGVVGTLGTYPRHNLLTEILEVILSLKRAVFRDKIFSSTYSSGSKWALCRPESTPERSQEGIRYGLGGSSLLTPLRNLMIRLCFPSDLLSIVRGKPLKSSAGCTSSLRKKVLPQGNPAGRDVMSSIRSDNQVWVGY